MIDHHSYFPDAALETEMLNASAPAPTGSAAYYMIAPSSGECSIFTRLIKKFRPIPQRRRVISGARTEATRPQKGEILPLASPLTSLPFVSIFF